MKCTTHSKQNGTMIYENIQSLEDLQKILEQHKDEVVLLDFYATWCRPCQRIKPYLHQMADDGVMVLVTCDVERSDKRMVRDVFQVKAMPTFIVFSNGKPFKRFTGANRHLILQVINEAKSQSS